MAELAVVELVMARIGAEWTPSGFTGSPLKVYKPNGETAPPTDGKTPFILLQFPVARSEHVGMASVGNRTFREEGAFRVVLSYPKGAGIVEPLRWVSQLRTLFRAWQSGQLTTYDPSPAIDNDGSGEGNYFILSTSVPYHYDLIA